MKNGMKKMLSAVLAVATTATLAVTAFAADYATAPVFPSTPVESVSVKTESINDAIDKAESADAEEAKVATVEVKSVNQLKVSPSVIKNLKNAEAVLEIVSPKATISIDPETITKVRKLDLSMKIYGSEKRSVVKFRGKKEFGCEVQIEVTSCKLSSEKLAKAHVYCDGQDLGAVEINDAGNPVITVTKAGTYIIK